MPRLIVVGVCAFVCIAPSSAISAEPNLILNGSFEAGNVGFNSDYLFAATAYEEGTYGIGTNPQALSSNFPTTAGDHTTGLGNMMVVNGSPQTDATVWSQSVPVAQDSQYAFSCWIASVYPSNTARLRFTVNGIQLGNTFNASTAAGSWFPFSATWNAGSNSSALIRIVDINTDGSGNDFALDDLALRPTAVPEPCGVLLFTELATLVSLSGLRRRANTLARAAAFNPARNLIRGKMLITQPVRL